LNDDSGNDICLFEYTEGGFAEDYPRVCANGLKGNDSVIVTTNGYNEKCL
jgi:hypothetical protein